MSACKGISIECKDNHELNLTLDNIYEKYKEMNVHDIVQILINYGSKKYDCNMVRTYDKFYFIVFTCPEYEYCIYL